jgi:hypothetical protein
MRGTKPRLRHLVGAATLTGSLLFAALTFASLPAGAQTTTAAATATVCPELSVGNPNPGDTVQTGDYVVSGEAWDPSASSGSGISRVEVFLGSRDQGGNLLGSTVPGMGNNPRAWSLEVTMPDVSEGNTFAAYAISGVTGQETAVLIPIFVGTPTHSAVGPTPTPIPTTETVTSTCPASAPHAPVAPAAPMASPAAPAPAAPAGGGTTGAGVAANACPVLTLGNPNPGDVVSEGDLVISGGAYVAGASPAPGMSRVDLFLNPRDQGGTFLGSGLPGSGTAGPNSWSVTVTIPDWGRGGSFNAYAIGANGQESSIGFPVFVGTVPSRNPVGATPTPVPQNVTTASTCH